VQINSASPPGAEATLDIRALPGEDISEFYEEARDRRSFREDRSTSPDAPGGVGFAAGY
jgi:hypothetical protein